MQLACIEYARSMCALRSAHTTEIDQNTPYPIIDILAAQNNSLLNIVMAELCD